MIPETESFLLGTSLCNDFKSLRICNFITTACITYMGCMLAYCFYKSLTMQAVSVLLHHLYTSKRGLWLENACEIWLVLSVLCARCSWRQVLAYYKETLLSFACTACSCIELSFYFWVIRTLIIQQTWLCLRWEMTGPKLFCFV